MILPFLALLFAAPVRGKTYFFRAEPPPPRAVRVGDAAYWIGKPRVIIPADVRDVRLSPNGRYVLALCYTPQPETFDMPDEAEPTWADVLESMRGYHGTTAPVAPAPPVVAPLAAVTVPTIEPRLCAFVNRIKAAPLYADTIGKDLKILPSVSGGCDAGSGYDSENGTV